VGIQQGGVESAVPEAIRASQLDKMLLFMSAEEKAALQDAYVLLDPALENYSGLIKSTPPRSRARYTSAKRSALNRSLPSTRSAAKRC